MMGQGEGKGGGQVEFNPEMYNSCMFGGALILAQNVKRGN